MYMKTGEGLYCKVHQSPRLSRVVLTSNLQHGTPNREHPPTIKANKARSTSKLVAVMLITEFKVQLTQQIRKKNHLNRDPLMEDLNKIE